MGFHLFDELNTTTAAYCHALGLDATPYETPLSAAEIEHRALTGLEANGVPLSPEEIEISHLMRKGWTRTRAERWAPVNIKHGVSAGGFHAIVEYAQTPEQVAADQVKFAESLGEYYAACRRRTIAPVFTGD